MRILVIDDEESLRHMLSVLLKQEGYDVVTTESAKSALKVLKNEEFDFVLSDIRMPEIDGLEFLKIVKKEGMKLTVIMMSAYGTVDLALQCIKEGAYDYISKPFKKDDILLTLSKAWEREKLKKENLRLKSEANLNFGIKGICFEDEKMHEVLDLVKKVASYDATVLITGETGVGKELIARAIHGESDRKDQPFIAVNCGAIPRELIESELFGHVKGAFTDAYKTKDGLFHEAHKGTILLDEIAELPKDLQVKLLRVLQESEVRRVGENVSKKVDVRVLAATMKDLKKEIEEGNFREDLYYRLNVIEVNVPPLRERKKDIKVLSDYFLSIFADKFNKDIISISDDAGKLLTSYKWPGNVRELENIIERAVILEDSNELGVSSLPLNKENISTSKNKFFSGDLSIKRASLELEMDFIKRALEETGGNRTKAAKLLQISHRALIYKIKNYKL